MTDIASLLMPHLMLAPIALPMLTAALMLLMREEQQRLKLGFHFVRRRAVLAEPFFNISGLGARRSAGNFILHLGHALQLRLIGVEEVDLAQLTHRL